MTSNRDLCEVEKGCTGEVQGFLCDEPEHAFHDDDTKQYPATNRCTAACDWHASTPVAQAHMTKPPVVQP